MAFSPHDAPTGEARQQLARQLEDRITRTAGSVRHVPDDEQEAAIDDALNHVRANPK
jgi:regulator of sirC expression with transglutaminase-like and TPR domain